MKPGGGVIDYHLEDRSGMFAEPLHPGCQNLAADGAGCSQAQLGDADGMASILMPAWAVQEKVPDRL